MYSQLVAVWLAAGGLCGCAFGVGPSSAANRQAPSGWMAGTRIVSVRTGETVGYGARWYDQWKSPIGVHGGIRRGWWKGGLDGRPSTSGDMTEMHFDVTLALAAFAASFTYIGLADNDTRYSDGPTFSHDASGPGAALSYALMPFISIDVMYARLSGPFKFGAGVVEMETDLSANRFSIGTTLRPLPIVGLKLDLNRIGGVASFPGQDMTWGAWGFSVEGIISLF